LLELGKSMPLYVTEKVELASPHGCTTINLHDKFHCTRRGYLEAIWSIAGKGKFS
jgi:D-serine deaminase-like pyridoxal phosphate-dependent protein